MIDNYNDYNNSADDSDDHDDSEHDYDDFFLYYAQLLPKIYYELTQIRVNMEMKKKELTVYDR